MDFRFDVSQFTAEIDRLKSELSELEAQFQTALTKTQEFLGIAESLGITAVCIDTSHLAVPATRQWGFHGNMVFAEGRGKSGWPVCWELCEKAGVSYGCGNSSQHQARTKFLLKGAWQKQGDTWVLLSHDPEETE